MLLLHSFAVIWWTACTTAAAFHRRGSASDTAPYSNVTALTTRSPVATTSLSETLSTFSLRPSRTVGIDGTVTYTSGHTQPTGVRLTGPDSLTLNITQSSPSVEAGSIFANPHATVNSTSPDVGQWINATLSPSIRISNATCIINVPSASIDYWYPPTYSHPLGTMTTSFGDYSKTESYTLVTETATFDAASALVSVYACTWSESYASEWDYTYTVCMEYTDQPTAASTSLVYRTAAAPFPPEGSIAVSDARFYDLYSEQPVATRPISIAPNWTVSQISATPYVHFTAYEIESGNKTETVQLPAAYVYPYGIKGMEHGASATGSLPGDFLHHVSRPDCDAGQLQAMVTVLIVVDLYYLNWPDNQPFKIHFESTALGFDDSPAIINDEGTPRMAEFTMDMSGWDLLDAPVNPTPASVKPSARVGPAPTSLASNNNNENQAAGSNEVQVPNGPQPTRITIGSVGTIPIILEPSSVVVIGSQTLQPGQPAVIVGGVTPVSLVPSATAVIVGGSTTLNLPQVFIDPAQEPARPPPLISIGSSLLTPNAATQFFIASSQILTPGGTAIVDGTLVSLAPSASFVVVGGSTQLLSRGPLTPTPPQIVFGSMTITALPIPIGSGGIGNNNNNQNGHSGPLFVIGDQLLVPGGQPITISDAILSLVSGGTSVVINGVTSAVINHSAVSAQPAIVIDNSIFRPVAGSGSTFIIAGQTLTPGGEAITVSGRVISLAPSASFVVVDGVTSTLVTPVAAAAAVQIAPPILSIGNGVFRPLPGPGASYLIGSMTLVAGGVITVADTTISLASGATALIINGRTSIITFAVQPITTNAPLLTVGSQTYTAVSGTTFIIDGQTLTPGGAVTTSGTTISLAAGATQLVYGSSDRSTTTALFPATTTQDPRVTSTAVPSAGSNGRNGQATATSQREGSASAARANNLVSSFFIIALGLLFV